MVLGSVTERKCVDADNKIHPLPPSIHFLLESAPIGNTFEYLPPLHSLLGEGSISEQVSPAVSHVYAACSSIQVTWELPPVEVVCSLNFHYVMEFNSSELNSSIKNELLTEDCAFWWNLARNKTYSVQLTAFSLSGKAVGSPWRQEVTITPSGMRLAMFKMFLVWFGGHLQSCLKSQLFKSALITPLGLN